MKESNVQKLKEIYEKYGRQMNISLILVKLKSVNILSTEDEALINAYTNDYDKITALFSVLYKKEDEMFKVLRNIFRRSDLIQQTPTNVFNPISPNRLNEDLKLHLKRHLAGTVPIWDKDIEPPRIAKNIFFNQDILRTDSNGSCERLALTEFDQLLANVHNRRILISGDLGYGKTTFVREMLSEWLEGKNFWTSQVDYLFYFPLGHLLASEMDTLDILFETCLSVNQNPKDIRQQVAEHANKTLLVFDGLDDIACNLCDEIDHILTGVNQHQWRIVATSRPGTKLDKLKASYELHLHLNGFTDRTVKDQSKIFGLSAPFNPTILKVPLFNSIFCEVREEGDLRFANVYNIVQRYVRRLCRKYSDTQIDDLLTALGVDAQVRYSMIEVVSLSNKLETISDKYLSIAKSSGLISELSTKSRILFLHRIIAEYAAAVYWSRNGCRPLFGVEFGQLVEFLFPPQGVCYANSWFSRFLSVLDKNYKLHLWESFKTHVPLLDDYRSLPNRSLDHSVLRFSNEHQAEDVEAILSKIRFDFDALRGSSLKIQNAHFGCSGRSPRVTQAERFERLVLDNCTVDVSCDELFRAFNFHILEFINCTFKTDLSPMNQNSGSVKGSRKLGDSSINLSKLIVEGPRGDYARFFNNVFQKRAPNLKHLCLVNFLNSISDEFANSIENNRRHLQGLTSFTVTSVLSSRFVVRLISKLPNLTELCMSACQTSIKDLNILADALTAGCCKKLHSLFLSDDENVGCHVPLMISLSKLSNLRTLDVADCRLTKMALNSLHDIFRLTKMEKCTFVNETTVCKDSEFLMLLNSCDRLKEIIFDKCGVFDIELQLIKDILSNFQLDSKKVIRNERVEAVLRFYK